MDRHRREAFERVALPLLDRMHAHALALTRDRDEARDLVQEAYLRAWRYFGGFRRGAEVKPWLYRILFNVFRAARGRGGRREVPWPETPGGTDAILYDRLVREGGWKDPIEADVRQFGPQLGDEVRRAVERLPETFRFPLLLCDLDELSYREIARIMTIPVNTVRSRIARARRRLETELAEYARQNGFLKSRRSR